jgi:hypothetical protein
LPRRLILTLASAALAALAIAAPAAAMPKPWGLVHLRSKDIPLGKSTHFKDAILRNPSHKAHAAVGSGTDAVLTGPDGTRITVTISSQYGQTPQSQAAAQNAVNFLSSRVHGTELSQLKVFVGPPAEISTICGAEEALACYAPGEERMYVPGETPPNSPVPVEYIITHEYGHHIANHRKNALGPAFTLGPEYWATSQFICAGVLSRPPAFYPGDEGDHYLDNPGEGWADSYAHLPENGFTDQPFQFSPLFHRDDAAFNAIRKDVLDPWKGNVTKTERGTLGSSDQKRFKVVVSLDGPVIARLNGPSGSDYNLRVRLGGQTVDKTNKAGSNDRVAGTLCSAPRQPPPNTLTFIVVRKSGSGPFTLKLTNAG